MESEFSNALPVSIRSIGSRSPCLSFFLHTGHYEELRRNRDELDLNLKQYRKHYNLLKDDHDLLKRKVGFSATLPYFSCDAISLLSVRIWKDVSGHSLTRSSAYQPSCCDVTPSSLVSFQMARLTRAANKAEGIPSKVVCTPIMAVIAVMNFWFNHIVVVGRFQQPSTGHD